MAVIEIQRFHAYNPLDPKSASGIMYPGVDGEWMRFEEHEKLSRPAPEVSMQMLIDAGLNGFALELMAESLVGKRDSIKKIWRLRFEFRGIVWTIESAPDQAEVPPCQPR